MNRKKNCLVCSSVLLTALFIFSSFTVASVESTANKPAGWLEPLDIGNPLMIKCFSGSLVEFVADCPLPNSCDTLRMENNTLICSNPNDWNQERN